MIRRSLLLTLVCGTVGFGAALAVRSHAAAPAGRYVVSNGTVFDTKTGLTWQQDYLSWNGNCEELVLDGHDDWRLPSANEILSIVDETQLPADPVFSFYVYSAEDNQWQTSSPGGWTIMTDGRLARREGGFARCVR
jgi:hypothetical protein